MSIFLSNALKTKQFIFGSHQIMCFVDFIRFVVFFEAPKTPRDKSWKFKEYHLST